MPRKFPKPRPRLAVCRPLAGDLSERRVSSERFVPLEELERKDDAWDGVREGLRDVEACDVRALAEDFDRECASR